ncbi:MAG TPA: tail fiber domain-containing protein [Ferruginibacter sp.]|nr:tail fiber domain-containing protein [Ferruginibacter sp.]
MKKVLLFLSALFCLSANAQNIGIGTNSPSASAMLDITASNKGILVPRLTNAQMVAIASPANGLLVYNTDSAAFAYHNAAAWIFLKGNTTASSDWSTRGNAGTNAAINFIGTTDNTALSFRVNNLNGGSIDPIRLNTFLGREAGNFTQTGFRNVAMGYLSLTDNADGQKNTAIGVQSLRFNSGGNDNTAVGYDAMFFNSSGTGNAAFGENSLGSLENGSGNVAIGLNALFSNVSGNDNVAVGRNAGNNNTGFANVFLGHRAGYFETGSNKLYIENSDNGPDQALIYGEFGNKILSIGGRLGVGTISPGGLLHLKNASTDANASQLIIEGNSNFGDATTSAIEFRSNFSSGGPGPSGRIKSYYTSNNYTDAKMTFQTLASGPFFVDAMTLTDGKVGIGTTTPHGDLQLPNRLGNRKVVLLEDADNDNQYNGFGINAFIMRYQAAALTSSHVFYAGSSANTSTELMRITGNGEVGIGKVPLTTNDDSRLQIKQKGFQNAIGVEASNSTNHWDFYIDGSVSNFNLFYNGSLKGSFDNVTGAYTSNSDRRLKKDITPYLPVLNNVLQLQAYQYHYLDNHPTDRFSNGFMAQDVQKIFPDAVVENELKNGEKRLGINYQYFTVLAIKGLQEQQQQIQSQEERIAKLEALVKTLTGGK